MKLGDKVMLKPKNDLIKSGVASPDFIKSMKKQKLFNTFLTIKSINIYNLFITVKEDEKWEINPTHLISINKLKLFKLKKVGIVDL